MRRLLPLVSFASVLLVIGGFVVFVVKITEPLVSAEKRPFALGVVVPDEALRRSGPMQIYVALHAGARPRIPEYPPGPGEIAVDEVETHGDGRFALRADPEHGDRFFVFARVETAALEEYCGLAALPRLRQEDGAWRVAATGERVPELRIEVGPDDHCPR